MLETLTLAFNNLAEIVVTTLEADLAGQAHSLGTLPISLWLVQVA